MVKNTILCAQYRLPYPIYWSGADISNLSFLDALSKKGFGVETLFVTLKQEPLEGIKLLLEKRGYKPVLSEEKLTYRWKNIEVNIVYDDNYFDQYHQLINQKHIDWIWHHNVFFRCPHYSRFFDVPDPVKHFVYLQSEEALRLLEPFKESFDLFLSNSKFCQNLVTKYWGVDSHVIFPVPDLTDYERNHFKQNRQYITFINPHVSKGAEIVFNLIKRFPDKNFLIVLGWQGIMPKDYDFTQFSNVIIQPCLENINQVYYDSRLVLIPSLVNETFGRVQVEAAYANVPSIVSRRGALSEVFSDNGLCLDIVSGDNTSLDIWGEAINMCFDEQKYQQMVDNCLNIKKRFSLNREVELLSQLIS